MDSEGGGDLGSGADLTVQSDELCVQRQRGKRAKESMVSFPGGVAVLARRFHAGRTI